MGMRPAGDPMDNDVDDDSPKQTARVDVSIDDGDVLLTTVIVEDGDDLTGVEIRMTPIEADALRKALVVTIRTLANLAKVAGVHQGEV